MHAPFQKQDAVTGVSEKKSGERYTSLMGFLSCVLRWNHSCLTFDYPAQQHLSWVFRRALIELPRARWKETINRVAGGVWIMEGVLY